MSRLKRISVFYRRAVFYVLLVSVCTAVLYAVAWYKGPCFNRIQVYDLTWPDTTDANKVVHRRWRYYMETKTNLPRRIEKFYKQDPNDDYVLQETLVIEYLTADEVKQVIKDAGLKD